MILINDDSKIAVALLISEATKTSYMVDVLTFHDLRFVNLCFVNPNERCIKIPSTSLFTRSFVQNSNDVIKWYKIYKKYKDHEMWIHIRYFDDYIVLYDVDGEWFMTINVNLSLAITCQHDDKHLVNFSKWAIGARNIKNVLSRSSMQAEMLDMESDEFSIDAIIQEELARLKNIAEK
jgi:hypothetical protein